MRAIVTIAACLAALGCDAPADEELVPAREAGKLPGEAGAAQPVEEEAGPIVVEESVTVAADPDEVWDLVGGACDIADWHMGVEDCEIVAGADGEVGAVRALNGGAVQEEFTAFDANTRTHSYVMTEGPFAGMDYEGTLSVMPGPAGGAIITWRDTVSPPPEERTDAGNFVRGLVGAGMEGMRQLVEGAPPAP